MSFLGEIKRRKVFQVAAVYAVVAWLLIQIVATVEDPLSLPDWADTLVIVLLAVGFPIALIMSWTFNLTSEGLVREQGDTASRQGVSRKIEYVLIGLLAIAMVWVIYRVEISPSDTLTFGGIDFPPNSIAVLPFENLSPDPDNAYFAAGIHESTLNQLAKIRDLTVMSRTSVMQYEQDPPPIPEIAGALNVETVLEGSVRYANGRVLITAQLIDGSTGRHLWSDEFNRELADIFAVQAEVARRIAAALEVQLLPDEQARIETRATESIEAYQHYLHAMSLPNFLIFPEYGPAFIESIKRAIAADPAFADAHAALAVGYFMAGDRDGGILTAQKAIELDPTLGPAHLIIGLRYQAYYSRKDEARAAFERAKNLSPNDPGILLESSRHLAEHSGQYEEAIQSGERAIAIAPHDASLHSQYGFLLLRAGNLAAAEKHIRESIRLDPGIYLTYFHFATVAYLQGNTAEAIDYLDRAVQMMSSGATFRVGYIGYLYGLLGETDKAAKQLSRLEMLLVDPQSEILRPLGWAVLGTRDRERALHEWTTVINGYLQEDRPVPTGIITRFRDNWLNDRMLEEPEFLELRRRLGFKG